MASDDYSCEHGKIARWAWEHGGQPMHYAVNMGLATGVLGLAALVKRSEHPALNKVLWVLLPSSLSSYFIYSGVKSHKNYHMYK
jgi:hypothetical protein